jgi:hypothetical protein
VNSLIGVPNLSPVDAAVATAAYLEFSHSATHGARAWVPGRLRRRRPARNPLAANPPADTDVVRLTGVDHVLKEDARGIAYNEPLPFSAAFRDA